jgi:hypothetical protein
VSIAFASYSDSIYVYFADSGGNQISTEYLGTTQYYDNRRVAVGVTVDDLGYPSPWGVDNNDFSNITKAFADAKIWWTGGIVTTDITDWKSLQDSVDSGFYEAASHSRTHPGVPYYDYSSEINGSKTDILRNLNLNPLYAKGNQQYLWCWIEPYEIGRAHV